MTPPNGPRVNKSPDNIYLDQFTFHFQHTVSHIPITRKSSVHREGSAHVGRGSNKMDSHVENVNRNLIY